MTRSTHQEIADGLLYAHSRLNANQYKMLEAVSFLYALVELLSERGLISIDELDVRKEVVAQRLVEQLRREGNDALFRDPERNELTLAGPTACDIRRVMRPEQKKYRMALTHNVGEVLS